jgi:hypothetical protein
MLVVAAPKATHARARRDASNLVRDLIPEGFAQGVPIPI